LRERWLNPPEWTVAKVLEFTGTVGARWHRYLVPSTITPNYQRPSSVPPHLEPRDVECGVKLKQRTLTNLYNECPTWLDLAHVRCPTDQQACARDRGRRGDILPAHFSD
jgi:hypothetical protein